MDRQYQGRLCSSSEGTRQAHTDRRKSTEDIIDELSIIPLSKTNVNDHLKKGLAGKSGKSPRKRGRRSYLDKDTSYKMCNYVAENSQDLEPISQLELQGTLQSLISDTPVRRLVGATQ
jgi:hypothetical protein